MVEIAPPLMVAEKLGCRLGSRWLWQGVDLALHPGEGVGLVAPSGAGKTRLLRTLALLDGLQQGSLWLAGRPQATWAVPAYRATVVYVPQRPSMVAGTVDTNLRQVFTLAVHRQRHYNPQQMQAWLGALGRDPDFLQRPADQLSGGEAQIVALLRALQIDPQILLLDEPTASLDGATTAQVEALLGQWLQAAPRAYLITSHDGAQIRRVSQRQIDLQRFVP